MASPAEGRANAPGAPSSSGTRRPGYDVRDALRHVTLAWMFGAGWMYATTGATLTRYARALGVSDFGFGLLAAVPYVAALAQLPASFFVERYGLRKSFLLLSGLAHRALWLAVALVPWAFPAAWWWPGLLVFVTLSSVCGNAATPPVLSWFADLVPGRIRGRYFSRRVQLGQAVGLAVTLVVGEVLDRVMHLDAHVLRRTISVILGAGALSGVMDFLILTRVPDVKHRADPGLSFWRLLRGPLSDRNFRWFAAYSATLTFSLGYVGQYIWLYVFDVVGMTNRQANVMLVAVSIIVSLGAYPLWGKLLDRWGCKAVLIVAGAFIAPGSAAWVFVTREHWWLGYLAAIVAMAAWPGVDLASFNLLLRMSGSQDRQRKGSAYVAVNSLVVAGAGLASGLFGGAVAKYLGPAWRGSLFGWPLTYHSVLFLISGALRLCAPLWLIGLREPERYPTLVAVRYLVANIYSNVQQAIFTPLRRLGRWSRLAYRLTQRRLGMYRAARHWR